MKAALLTGPRTIDELMAQACVLELESIARYEELADVMHEHNNREVADLFRSLAAQESQHARQIQEQMGWSQPPAIPVPGAPQAPALEQAHYLMKPWHALQIALAAEQRAYDFFTSLVPLCEDEALRKAAQELQAEEREHVALLEGWLQRVPEPPEDWDQDPDPPRYTD